MKLLLCTDLDNTLIHSFKKREESDICVEKIDGREQGFMSERAYKLLDELNRKLVFVPVTTRSIEQYTRLSLIKDGVPSYAVAVHGGVLFNGTERDSEWDAFALKQVEASSEQLIKARILICEDSNCDRVRDIDGIYVLTKSKAPFETGAMLTKNLDAEIVTVTVQGEKVYVIPRSVEKGTAVKRLAECVGADFTIAAGDSVMDIPMLNAADIAIIPDERLQDKLSTGKVIICPKDELDFAYFILKTAQNYLV